MKKNAILFSLFLSLCAFAQTQLEMNAESAKKSERIDKELNIVYQQILKKYSEDKLFLKKLKASQNIWIKFRDAEIEARFPEENKRVEYGSTYPICLNDYFNELTQGRIKQLKVWLNGVPDGEESCSGSVK